MSTTSMYLPLSIATSVLGGVLAERDERPDEQPFGQLNGPRVDLVVVCAGICCRSWSYLVDCRTILPALCDETIHVRPHLLDSAHRPEIVRDADEFDVRSRHSGHAQSCSAATGATSDAGSAGNLVLPAESGWG
jgi:hypothetical protein